VCILPTSPIYLYTNPAAEYAEASPISQAAAPLMERGGKGKFAQLMGNARQPLEQRIQNKQNGVGRQNRPYVGKRIEVAQGPRS
jgi:hypothetical protein